MCGFLFYEPALGLFLDVLSKSLVTLVPVQVDHLLYHSKTILYCLLLYPLQRMVSQRILN